MQRAKPTFLVLLTAFSLTLAQRARAEESVAAQVVPPSVPPSRPLGSVRAVVALGLADLGAAGRIGLAGEWWTKDWIGIGAHAAYGEDSGFLGGGFRDVFTLEPQVVLRTDGRVGQLMLGAGAGVAY